MDQEDHILVVILYVFVIIVFMGITFFWANSIANAAYNLSELVTKGQIEKAENLGAIQRTQLEVVNNYGSQLENYNPQEQ
jgi:predicted PurR-regulated permease PerM